MVDTYKDYSINVSFASTLSESCMDHFQEELKKMILAYMHYNKACVLNGEVTLSEVPLTPISESLQADCAEPPAEQPIKELTQVVTELKEIVTTISDLKSPKKSPQEKCREIDETDYGIDDSEIKAIQKSVIGRPKANEMNALMNRKERRRRFFLNHRDFCNAQTTIDLFLKKIERLNLKDGKRMPLTDVKLLYLSEYEKFKDFVFLFDKKYKENNQQQVKLTKLHVVGRVKKT